MPQLQMVEQRFQTNRWQWTVCHFVFALATHQKESQKQIKAGVETETCMVVLTENKAACKIEWRCRWTSQMACFKGQRWSTFFIKFPPNLRAKPLNLIFLLSTLSEKSQFSMEAKLFCSQKWKYAKCTKDNWQKSFRTYSVLQCLWGIFSS